MISTAANHGDQSLTCSQLSPFTRGARDSGEYEENVERLPFQASEVYAIWQALKPAEAAAARERQLAGLRRGDADPVREARTVLTKVGPERGGRAAREWD